MSTRHVALALLAQSAPSVFFGYASWGLVSAVLGCGMWALSVAEAHGFESATDAASLNDRRLRQAEERLAALEGITVQREREVAGISEKLASCELMAVGLAEAVGSLQGQMDAAAKRDAEMSDKISSLATQRAMRSI